MDQRLPPDLKPDTDAAIQFLKSALGDRPAHLVAIKEKKGPVAKTFTLDQADAAKRWIAKHNASKSSIYWHVNELKPGCKDRKATKEDVARVVMFHVDVDDPSEAALAKLKGFAPRPTSILFSGGGYQAFWLLETPTDDLVMAEAINKGLAATLGGDNCHNADRLMRVPGTINWPNAKKKRAGRKPVLAYVL